LPAPRRAARGSHYVAYLAGAYAFSKSSVFVLELATLGLHLHPARARTGPIDRILPLANDPLKSEACALGKQDVAISEALTEAQQVTLDTGQPCLEPRAPLFEWVIPHVEVPQFRQVNAGDACWHTPSVQQGREIGLAVGAGRDECAVYDARSHRQREDGRVNRREPACEFAPVLAEDGRRSASFAQPRPKPIELDRGQPILARWR
jgi:hypothetical protein